MARHCGYIVGIFVGDWSTAYLLLMHSPASDFQAGPGPQSDLASTDPSDEKTAPAPEMTQKSPSGRFGTDCGHKYIADGQNTGLQNARAEAQGILGPFLVRCRTGFGTVCARNLMRMDQTRVANCPGLRPGQFGTGVGSVRSTCTANIGTKPTRRLIRVISAMST